MVTYVFTVIILACAIEFYKKGIRGVNSLDGVKTKAGKWELYAVAFVLSCLASLLFYKVEGLSNIWAYFLSAPSMYFLQYFIDMKVVKNLVNTVVGKGAGK